MLSVNVRVTYARKLKAAFSNPSTSIQFATLKIIPRKLVKVFFEFLFGML